MDHSENLAAIALLQDKPHILGIRAEKRFLLLRECEGYLGRQKERLGPKFRKVKAITEYCDENGISPQTFYRWYAFYKTKGIEGLLPGYKRRGSPYRSMILPLIEEIVEEAEPHKGYMAGFQQLKTKCTDHGVKLPNYATFLRLVKAEGLSDCFTHSHPVSIPEPGKVEDQRKTPKVEAPYIPDEPGWMRITNKKAFNVAICKYNLILPFLDPALNLKEKKKLFQEITEKLHFALPGVAFKISPGTLYRLIASFKREGFEALVPQYFTRKERRRSNDHTHVQLTIDPKNPLAVLGEIREIIKAHPLIPSETKSVSVRLLDESISSINSAVARYKPLGIAPPLTKEEIALLEAHRLGPSVKYRMKAMTILMANKNRTMLEIMAETDRPLSTIYRWLQKFKDERTEFIVQKRHSPAQKLLKQDRKTRIVDILHASPSLYGINRTSWSYPTLTQAYNQLYNDKVSESIVGRALKTIGYSWRRARKVLTSKDPQYREKVDRVLAVLQNLQEGEAFFFIDEAGPYQVRKWGGKSLTLGEDVQTVPQFQKPKGRVMLIGALEAVTNQMTWAWIENKGVQTICTFLTLLHEKYAAFAKLFLTWDALSSHRSKTVSKLIDKMNSDARNGIGPSIEIVPLPNNSQFLNVIESVFSGMKKAVVHNSDYQLAEEMRVAIAKHFESRNAFFKENPKRAGNKIWDKQFFDLDRIKGGVFKRM
ncbi:MAG: IS630 family transposase [Syntrophobacter sp.]